MIHHFEDDLIDLPYFSVHQRNYVFFRNGSDLMRFCFFSDYINQLFKVPIIYLRLWPRCPFCWVFFFWNPWKWLECRSIVSWFGKLLKWTGGWFSSLDGSLIGSFAIPPFVHWKRKFLLHIIIFCRYHLDSFGMMNILMFDAAYLGVDSCWFLVCFQFPILILQVFFWLK